MSGSRVRVVLVVCLTLGGLVLGLPEAATAETGVGLRPASPATGAADTVGLYAVACPSTTYCIAVGHSYGPAAVAKRWANGKWTWLTPAKPVDAGESFLNGVSCLSVSNCIAVGSYMTLRDGSLSLAEHWNGTKWTRMSTPNPKPTGGAHLFSVACSRATNCMAVGVFQFATVTSIANLPLAEHWNGTRWTVVPATQHAEGILNDVACPGSDNCIAVGSAIEHWNGTSWTSTPAAAPTGAEGPAGLAAVNCISATNCTAIGSYLASGNSVIVDEHWDGVNWTTLPTAKVTGDGATLLDVACTSSSSCNAVGGIALNDSAGTTLAEHWNGATWGFVATPTLPSIANPPPGLELNVFFAGIACPSASRCIAVGGGSADGALAEIWNGSGWKVMPPVPH